MLAKLTSKNQLTLPKAVVDAVDAAEYFDVAVHAGQIVLTPVRMQRADAVRAKLAALGIGEADVSAAVRWSRRSRSALAAQEPEATYRTAGPRAGRKTAPRKAAASKAAPSKAPRSR